MRALLEQHDGKGDACSEYISEHVDKTKIHGMLNVYRQSLDQRQEGRDVKVGNQGKKCRWRGK